MKNYIYIKNDGIQVVSQKDKKKETYTVPLEEGAIINGVMMNEKAIKEAIATIHPKLAHATLVVDSSNIIIKKLVIPTVSDSKLNEILKGEFDLYNKEEQYLFDTNVIRQTSSEMTVLCYAVTKDFIDHYIKIFQELHIKLERIEVAINGVIKYINTLADKKDKTFLINIVTGHTMLSLLFEGGEYKFSNRSRLLHTDEPALLAQELYSRLSSMIQFSQSEKSDFAITESYYTGLDNETLQEFNQLMATTSGAVEVKVLEEKDFDLAYLYPCAAAFVNKSDVNLLKNKQTKYKAAKTKKKIATKFIVVMIVLGVLALNMAALMVEKMSIAAENKGMEEYLTSEEVVVALSTYEEIELANALVAQEMSIFTWIVADIEASGILNGDVLGELYDTTLISMSYSLASGTINVNAQEASSQSVVNYVAALRDSGYFANVVYPGYSLDTTTGVYTFSVDTSMTLVESEEADD